MVYWPFIFNILSVILHDSQNSNIFSAINFQNPSPSPKEF